MSDFLSRKFYMAEGKEADVLYLASGDPVLFVVGANKTERRNTEMRNVCGQEFLLAAITRKVKQFVASVYLSVRPYVSTLSFKPTDF